MKALVSFGTVSVVVLLGLFVLYDSSVSGLHHVPLGKVNTKVPYPLSLRASELAITCVAPDNSRLKAGHCWFDAQDDEWFWCLPRMVDLLSGQDVPESAVVESFESMLMDSTITITGVRLVQAPAERCVREQGQDVYR